MESAESPTIVGWIRETLHDPTLAMFLLGSSFICTGLLAILLTRRAPPSRVRVAVR